MSNLHNMQAEIHNNMPNIAQQQETAQNLLQAAKTGNPALARQYLNEGALLELAHEQGKDAFDIALEKVFELRKDQFGQDEVYGINKRYAQVAQQLAPHDYKAIDVRLSKFSDLNYSDEVLDDAQRFLKSLKMIKGAQ
jgi:hypothetical protein